LSSAGWRFKSIRGLHDFNKLQILQIIKITFFPLLITGFSICFLWDLRSEDTPLSESSWVRLGRTAPTRTESCFPGKFTLSRVERVTHSDCSFPLFVIPGLPRTGYGAAPYLIRGNPVFLSLKDQKIAFLEQRGPVILNLRFQTSS
jgi:hypothetical protein